MLEATYAWTPQESLANPTGSQDGGSQKGVGTLSKLAITRTPKTEAALTPTAA
jgi:hypothetical protein